MEYSTFKMSDLRPNVSSNATNLEHYLNALKLLGRSLPLQHAYQTGATSRTTDVLATMAARYMQTHNTDPDHTHTHTHTHV